MNDSRKLVWKDGMICTCIMGAHVEPLLHLTFCAFRRQAEMDLLQDFEERDDFY